MTKITRTRKIIWGALIVAIVATYAFRIHIVRKPGPKFRDIAFNSFRYSEREAPFTSVDVSDLPDEIPVSFWDMRIIPQSGSAVLFLRTEDEKLYLPIFIGPVEASAISRSLEGIVPPRPLTHELLVAVIDEVGGNISKVVVSSIEKGTYKALLVIEKTDGAKVYIDARPSDSIALALLKGADIFVASSVMEKTGEKTEEETGKEAPEKPEPTGPPELPEGDLI